MTGISDLNSDHYAIPCFGLLMLGVIDIGEKIEK